MSLNVLLIVLLAALLTAAISGVFGMAGGLVFMGVIASFMGAAQAMVVHGAVQGMSNSYRAYLLRKHIRWDIFGKITLGALPALALIALIAYVPSKGILFLTLGLLPILLWLPKSWINFDAQISSHALLCGFCVCALNLIAGVAGPAMDMFFVKTNMQRREIVATKALTMFSSHILKIIYFGLPLLQTGEFTGLPPWWFFALALPFIMLGTFTGTRILKRLTDSHFRLYTKGLVSVIGVIYIWRGLTLLKFF